MEETNTQGEMGVANGENVLATREMFKSWGYAKKKPLVASINSCARLGSAMVRVTFLLLPCLLRLHGQAWGHMGMYMPGRRVVFAS